MTNIFRRCGTFPTDSFRSHTPCRRFARQGPKCLACQKQKSSTQPGTPGGMTGLRFRSCPGHCPCQKGERDSAYRLVRLAGGSDHDLGAGSDLFPVRSGPIQTRLSEPGPVSLSIVLTHLKGLRFTPDTCIVLILVAMSGGTAPGVALAVPESKTSRKADGRGVGKCLTGASARKSGRRLPLHL